MKRVVLFLLLTTTAWADPQVLMEQDSALPVTTFNLTFRVGSADDPAGNEGLAYLTGRLVREGGVNSWSGLPAQNREEVEKSLFPLGVELEVKVRKEQTTFAVTTTAEDSFKVAQVLAQMLLAPAFDETEFKRIQTEQSEFLSQQMPNADQEELGKEALDYVIYGKDHPYAHAVQGRISSVKKLTLDQVRSFYQAQYTQNRLTIGLAGAITPELKNYVTSVFKALPLGAGPAKAVLPATAPGKGIRVTVVKGNFTATGVHFGHSLPLNRASEDFPTLLLGSQAFGKHRTFVGRLIKVVREKRGLNYGDYSYIEDFPEGGDLQIEPTQVAREQQAFKVWVRPVTPDNGCFALKQVHREIVSLAEKGLTEEEFNLTQSHLMGALPLLGATLARHLAYGVDSLFYGIQGDYLQNAQAKVKTLNKAEVDQTLAKYIHPSDLEVVIVTQDADQVIRDLQSPSCQVHYAAGAQHPKEITDEDAQISSYSLNLDPQAIEVVEAEKLFE